MSSQSSRTLRRERRAAAAAARRTAARRPAGEPRRFGIVQITVVSVVAGLALVGAILLFNGQSKAPPVSVTPASAPAGLATNGFVLGKADAPVTIELYEDFQCPACLSWGQNVFPTLARNELAAGTVKIQFHGYAFIGQESRDAAEAAWAANEQGRFWDMWATLYANQGLHENGGAFVRDRLIAMADAIGLDHDRFLADFDSAAAATAVSQSSASAVAAGITATPSLVINGTFFTGSGYADLSAAIAAAAG